MTRYPLFDRTPIELRDLAERGHDIRAADCLPLEPPGATGVSPVPDEHGRDGRGTQTPGATGVSPVPDEHGRDGRGTQTPDATGVSPVPFVHPEFGQLIERIAAARQNGWPVILMMGAHPIKLGLSRFLVDLVERRIVTHLATNGAGMIHDFELASFGGTSEDVARWIRAGQFGLWKQTGRLNEIVAAAAAAGEGIGEAIGRTLEAEQAPHRALSLAAAGWRAGVPVTSHVSIGSDIVHAHANCDGAAWGAASYTDFLLFARSVQDLEGGVFLNVGTAVTGPEVYLKALSMARNVARQRGQEIRRFTTALFDLVSLPEGWRAGPPTKEHAQYYYRPWKTILARTVADGGESFYFCGDHRQTIPALWKAFDGGLPRP